MGFKRSISRCDGDGRSTFTVETLVVVVVVPPQSPVSHFVPIIILVLRNEDDILFGTTNKNDDIGMRFQTFYSR